MKSSSEHGDLILFAVVASLILHGVLMFFAAPHVMSHTAGSSDFEARRTHRPPMSVRRFEGDPFRERVKSVPASDVPAPRSAPTVAQASASSAPTAAPSSGDVPIPAPPVVVPQVLSGPMDAPAELPRPSILNANAIEDTGFTMPSAAEIDAAAPSLPVAPLSAASGGAESVIPVPGMSAPAPVFTLPEIKVGDGAMAGIEAAIWCETVSSFSDLQFLLLPRLAGVAEKGWSRVEQTAWDEYSQRLAAQQPLWEKAGWNYFKSSMVPWQD